MRKLPRRWLCPSDTSSGSSMKPLAGVPNDALDRIGNFSFLSEAKHC